MFNLESMPLFLVENPIVILNPNHPECIAAEDVPNLDLLDKVLRDPFPKESLFPMETIIIACSNPPQSSCMM